MNDLLKTKLIGVVMYFLLTSAELLNELNLLHLDLGHGVKGRYVISMDVITRATDTLKKNRG
jgi:hypothetical protein